MTDCLFCRIVEKEIPSCVIYEDETWIAFLDIKPLNPGHTLLVPKNHSRNLFDLPEQSAISLGLILKKLSLAVKIGANADGINIGLNNEAAAGQLIFHTHIHIIPRYTNDGYQSWHRQSEPSSSELDEVGKTIKNAL